MFLAALLKKGTQNLMKIQKMLLNEAVLTQIRRPEQSAMAGGAGNIRVRPRLGHQDWREAGLLGCVIGA